MVIALTSDMRAQLGRLMGQFERLGIVRRKRERGVEGGGGAPIFYNQQSDGGPWEANQRQRSPESRVEE